MKLTSKVNTNDITDQISSAFDFKWDGINEFEIPTFDMPKDFNIGLIVGPSGSGKTSLINHFNREETAFNWNPKESIGAQFGSFEEANDRLNSVALSSIPDWVKPYHTLSTGQKFRADMAMAIKDNATIDEFTSVVDRNVAKAASNAIHKYIKGKDYKNVLFVGCHYDIIEWLRPDWIYDTKTRRLTTKEALRRDKPKITLEVIKSDRASWELFKGHHYLTASLPNGAHCWTYHWNNIPVGFGGVQIFPHPHLTCMWNISRVVVLPDFQGLGFGSKIIKHLAETVTGNYHKTDIQEGWGKCKIRTANPKLNAAFDRNPNWEFVKGSDDNKGYGKTSRDPFGGQNLAYSLIQKERPCRSYKYVGPRGNFPKHRENLSKKALKLFEESKYRATTKG